MSGRAWGVLAFVIAPLMPRLRPGRTPPADAIRQAGFAGSLANLSATPLGGQPVAGRPLLTDEEVANSERGLRGCST